MDDRQIQDLVRMALEAEALESSGAQSGDSLPLTLHRGRRRPWLAWASAAAACVAVGGGVWLAMRPTPTAPGVAPRLAARDSAVRDPSPAPPGTEAPPRAVAARPAETVPPQAAEPSEHSVVLTIFRDAYGELSCVQWRPHEWGDRSLAELTPGEILDAGGAWCDGAAAEMLVVAVSGPAGSVPVTDGSAEELAECIAYSGDLCEQEPGTYASVTLSCLPPGVEAVAEVVPVAPF